MTREGIMTHDFMRVQCIMTHGVMGDQGIMSHEGSGLRPAS